MKPRRFTESQKGWGWSASLEVIKCKPPAQGGSATAGCPGPLPDGFCVSSRLIFLNFSVQPFPGQINTDLIVITFSFKDT